MWFSRGMALCNKQPKMPIDDKPLISVAKSSLLVDLNQNGSAEGLFLNKK
jgi:hypothetical protein